MNTKGGGDDTGEHFEHHDGSSLAPLNRTPLGPTKAMQELEKITLQAHDEQFTQIKMLGRGGFGKVWLCECVKGKVNCLPQSTSTLRTSTSST
jgi:hypothetical protein